MKTGLLTSASLFGKYVPNQNNCHLESEHQNYTHERPFLNCKFDIPGNRLYLLDTSGVLIHLNLNDSTFSTLKGQKIQNFTVDGNNSLNLLYVSQKSQLFRLSFENKKPTKITNLNMNRIIAFQRNYLRDMLLCLDYKLLFLCDVNKSGPLKIKSLKAKNDQIFTNACFASNNRFIILAIKNIEVRIVQIMDLKSVHNIKLPFALDNIKMEVSYDSRRIAIYGDCHIIFFINLLENQTYSYELIQVPFLKSIALLKYTCENDIVFLGSDQIIYAVSPNQPDKAVPIFNQQFQMRTMSFDISLDCNKIAIVCNRTVLQIKFPKGLRKQIQQKSSFKQMEFRKNAFEPQKIEDQPIIQDSQEHIEDQPNKQIQYEDEDDQQEEVEDKQENCMKNQIKLGDLLRQNQQYLYKQECGALIPHVSDLKGVSSEIKAKINSVFNNLLIHHKQIARSRSSTIINSLLVLTRDYRLDPQKSYRVMEFIIRNMASQIQKIRQYGLVLCPEIVAIIQKKLNLNFAQFCQNQILGLFSSYFRGKEWIQSLNWVLSAGVNQKSQNLPLLLISIFEIMFQIVKSRDNKDYNLFLQVGDLQVNFSQVYNRLVKIYLDDRYKNLFVKRKVVQMVGEAKQSRTYKDKANNSRLEQLIIKQDQIKRALSELKRSRAQGISR